MQLMRIFWDTVVALDTAARVLDEGVCFALCRPESLRVLFQGAGLRDVRVAPIVGATVLHDFDDFWTPFSKPSLSGPGR
jgi:hypothetical protein